MTPLVTPRRRPPLQRRVRRGGGTAAAPPTAGSVSSHIASIPPGPASDTSSRKRRRSPRYSTRATSNGRVVVPSRRNSVQTARKTDARWGMPKRSASNWPHWLVSTAIRACASSMPWSARTRSAGHVAARLDRRLEPLGLGAAEERVADAERDAAQRQAGRDPQDRLVGVGVELAADRRLDVGGADVEGLDRDLGRARDDERAREAAGARVELRLGDERAAALDADDLAVVLEDRERLAHDDRLTPKRRASSGSDGSASPVVQVPDSICSLRTSCSW